MAVVGTRPQHRNQSRVVGRVDIERLMKQCDQAEEAFLHGANSSASLLSVKQAASYLGVCPNTILNLRKRGELESIRVGPRLVRFRREQLDAVLK
jgi:excisionase family DNA binding protein